MPNSAEDRDFLDSVTRVRRIFSWGLGMMAFLWLFVIPTFELWQHYSQTKLEAQIRLALVADRISSFIAANLDIWEFEGVRLPSVVAGVLRGGGTPPSRLAFVDPGGGIIEFPVQGEKANLSLHLEDSVTDGRRVVGRVVMDVGLDEALRPALLSGFIGLGSVGLLLLLARMIGRNALDRSLAVISDKATKLARRVHELEEARRQLAAHSASLEMANQDITHVALLSTHHLREPLRTILSYSQLLVRWHESGDEREIADGYLFFLKSGIGRMQAQLKALSEYLGLRERDVQFAPVELGPVLAMAAERIGSAISLTHGALPSVMGEEAMLADLFSDLLVYVLRHRQPGDTCVVTVSAVPREGYWDIRLADNGRPFEDRDPERIFNLLVHADDGNMITGLAPARLMAFLMGGSLRAEPGALPDTGAILNLALPGVDGREAQAGLSVSNSKVAGLVPLAGGWEVNNSRSGK